MMLSIVFSELRTVSADVIAVGCPQTQEPSNVPLLNEIAGLGVPESRLKPQIDEAVLINTLGVCSSPQLLLIGCPPITEFGYTELRHFCNLAISALKTRVPHMRHFATVLHGPSMGLDQAACFDQQFQGLRDALSLGDCPRSLERMSIAEDNPERFASLLLICDRVFGPPACSGSKSSEWQVRGSQKNSFQTGKALAHPSIADSDETPSVFVAMPYRSDMRDIWKYGIESPVHQIGYLCERVDQEHFTGEILPQIRRRIERAVLVIADITEANPNVLLEIGYAWGLGRPTLLLSRRSSFSAEKVPFDVRGHRCLLYADAVELEELLRSELPHLLFGRQRHLRSALKTSLDDTRNDPLRSPLPDQEDTTYASERRRLIDASLSRLSTRDADILRRFYLLEQSPVEICDALSLTETQFRILKSRAKAKFDEIGRKLLSPGSF